LPFFINASRFHSLIIVAKIQDVFFSFPLLVAVALRSIASSEARYSGYRHTIRFRKRHRPRIGNLDIVHARIRFDWQAKPDQT